jgi:uncharacterized membrane protein YphA (DoxX/SURF4 family)
LLLRLALATFLLQHFLAWKPLDGMADQESWPAAIATLAGVLLLVGLWTPISAGIAAALQVWIAFQVSDARAAHLLAAGIAAGLCALGPGAWSVDARLFGRRRISMDGD